MVGAENIVSLDELKFKICDTNNRNAHNYIRFKSKEL